jgi:maltose-binding protein MalE
VPWIGLDVAAAAEIYARRVKLSQETVDYALEIKLRAERGLSEMLARTPKHKGRLKRGPAVPKENYAENPNSSRAWCDKKLSSQSQKLAAVPAKEFEKTNSFKVEIRLADSEEIQTDFEVEEPDGSISHVHYDPYGLERQREARKQQKDATS